MKINEVIIKTENKINQINSKINEKLINFESFKSISNTSLNISTKINEKNNLSSLSMRGYIKACQNILSSNKNSVLFIENKNVNLPKILNDSVNDNDITAKIVGVEGDKKIKKLSDWVTNSGKKELNTNQKLYFKTEKTRSFKNLLILLTSPFKFINRSLLPIKINLENKNVNKALDTFKFDNIPSNNDAFSKFSNKLNQLNKTFNENINNVISKRINNKKMDNMIKYHTLEKALECKLINDIKLIRDELKANLIKNRFEKNYFDLPDKILSRLDFIVNSNLEELFSSNTSDNLKSFLMEEVNNKDKNIKLELYIDNILDSIFNKKKKEIIKGGENELKDVKKELAIYLTKELFSCLSKDEKFFCEEPSISEVDELIKTVSNDIYENMGRPTEKIINSLNDSFYENIKQNDNKSDFLTRLFENSSNDINYKWAKDAVILLISYESFENKIKETTTYYNNGVADNGGEGTVKMESTALENKLKNIFGRLGLSINDLDKSKDEVLRKYFANYFKRIYD